MENRGLIGEQDLYLFNQGTHDRMYRRLGSHLATREGEVGVAFAVWAPNAASVSVIGEFNGWDKGATPMAAIAQSGIWQAFVPGLERGAAYKYHLRSRVTAHEVDKADPYAFRQETPPATGSVVWDLAYEWGDAAWMRDRKAGIALTAPVSIYEVHLGSWRRVPEDGGRSLTYREIAEPLAEYVSRMGFTHVELLPLTEHPFYGSWGYQTTGYFAPTSRYGTPQDLMFLVDTLHRRGIGVILDWVPSHFPTDEHGLAYFDGTHLYEHADRRQGHQPDWDSFVFNYGRHEVRSFLVSSALFWLDAYHVDGLRVDAVASMLYLDYSRKQGEWIPNAHGGRENLEAIGLPARPQRAGLPRVPRRADHRRGVHVVADGVAAALPRRPGVRPEVGHGLDARHPRLHGAGTRSTAVTITTSSRSGRCTRSPRTSCCRSPTTRWCTARGPSSTRCPGTARQRFANLRLLFAYMYAQPGKKLLFMGGEFGQGLEWNHDRSLDWHLLDVPLHAGVQAWVEDLNRLYRAETAMHALDCEPAGFEWVDCCDAEHSVAALLRRDARGGTVLAVLNFTPVGRTGYRVGVPRGGSWSEALNSDAERYGGQGWGNYGRVEAEAVPAHGRPHSVALTLPPLGALFLTPSPA